MGECLGAGGFFWKFAQAFGQNTALSAQCVHQIPAALARDQVVSQVPRRVPG